MDYKTLIKMTHPYEGDSPQECVEEEIPVMTGHDERVRLPQLAPNRWGSLEMDEEIVRERVGPHPGV